MSVVRSTTVEVESAVNSEADGWSGVDGVGCTKIVVVAVVSEAPAVGETPLTQSVDPAELTVKK